MNLMGLRWISGPARFGGHADVTPRQTLTP